MHSANLPRAVAIEIALIVVFAGLSAAEDETKKKGDSAKDVAVPADLENWKIEFDGVMDQPRQQPKFHVSLARDGTMLVETWQGKDERRKLFSGKLTEDETRAIFDQAAKIVNGYKSEKRDGNWGDGWDLSMAVSAKMYSRKVTFTQQHDPSDERNPTFRDMAKLIRGKLKKGERFP